LRGKAAIALEYLLKRSGPMSMAPSRSAPSPSRDPRLETPDLQYHVQPLSLDRFGEPLHPFPAITASVCICAGEPRSVQRRADFGEAPSIRPNYPPLRATAGSPPRRSPDPPHHGGQADGAPCARGVRPGAARQDDDDPCARAGEIGTTIFHPVGTVRMGSDSGAVVDERLRVRASIACALIDASVMPAITSANTNAPTLMIAEKGARLAARGPPRP